MLSSNTDKPIQFWDLNNLTLENITVDINNPTGYIICGIYLSNTMAEKIDNVTIIITLNNNINSSTDVYGISAEGEKSHISAISNSKIKINATEYVYKTKEVTGFKLRNVDEFSNCKVNINKDSTSDNLKATNIIGINLDNAISINNIDINIDKANVDGGSIVGLYAHSSSNSSAEQKATFENINVNLIIPYGNTSTFTIN